MFSGSPFAAACLRAFLRTLVAIVDRYVANVCASFLGALLRTQDVQIPGEFASVVAKQRANYTATSCSCWIPFYKCQVRTPA